MNVCTIQCITTCEPCYCRSLYCQFRSCMSPWFAAALLNAKNHVPENKLMCHINSKVRHHLTGGGTALNVGAFVWIWSRSWIYERSLDVIDSCCFWTRSCSWICERSFDISAFCCFSTRSRSLSCIESILLCERSPDISDSCCFCTRSCSSL